MVLVALLALEALIFSRIEEWHFFDAVSSYKERSCAFFDRDPVRGGRSTSLSSR